ncbi:adenylyl-sulfate kinase [archaeon]|jgi:adenylylsulfate kinase|nr:adenylyl-sulfate kinase [archaeon]MBT4647051.1 adenylyl-sulfate kinase [archaeon]MBT6820960.1 adenylyl-sulfate kinase [archaeon]MBT7392152.1 adenylyl-sulfate kinase [archaeon]
MKRNISKEYGYIDKEKRSKLIGLDNNVIWFTGFSGSGKSTLAYELEKNLVEKGILSFVLDGDNVRHGLNSDLGFSLEDREENIRRIAEVSKLFYDSGIFLIVSFISPYNKDREYARKLIGKDFIEVYVKCSIEECKNRDPKGLYKKVEKGEILNFTGISDPYEIPKNPEIVLNTENLLIDECIKKLLKHINI